MANNNFSSDVMSPIALFMQADIVVKSVMVGLVLASIWTWAIIVGHALRLNRASRGSLEFERDFWKADDIDRFYETRGQSDLPSARVLAAGIAEWRRSTGGKTVDREGARKIVEVPGHGRAGFEPSFCSARGKILRQLLRVGDRFEHLVDRPGDPRRDPEFQIHDEPPLNA